MNTKSFQNASKNRTKNRMNFALERSRNIDPIKGVQRTSVSLPKFNLGPLVRPKRRQSASRRYPKRFDAESETEIITCYSLLHCLLFDFLPMFPIKRYLVSEIGKAKICFESRECIQKSNKESSQPYMKHNIRDYIET